MIRTIIVEDEYLVRERIKKCVDWAGLGFEIAGEASNGEDALELVKQVEPMLAIVDINMPFINGLDFAKIMRENHPDLKIIILTGYSSFEYARSALQTGVLNYLLKPVNKDELQKVLMEIRGRIDREQKQREGVEKLKISSRQGANLLKLHFVQTLLDGINANLIKDMDEKLRLYCPALADDDLFVMVLSIDRLASFCQSENDSELWSFALANILEEVFQERGGFTVSQDAGGRVVFITNAAKSEGSGYGREFIARCEKTRNLVKEYLHFTVTIGLGRVHKGIGEISLSYKEALTAVKNKLVLGNDRIISYEAIEAKLGTMKGSPGFRQNMLVNLRLGNVRAVREEISGIFKSIPEKGILVDNLYMVLSELLLAIIDFARENEINLSEVTSGEINISGLIEENESLQDIEAWFSDFLEALMKIYNKRKLLVHARVIDRVKVYIDRNYSNKDLGLENIASNISINPSHLSNIFKKEAGLSITEYLTERRMRMAKELMDEGKLKLFEIADRVGFNDPYYFSKCFKKLYGISPSKYFRMK